MTKVLTYTGWVEDPEFPKIFLFFSLLSKCLASVKNTIIALCRRIFSCKKYFSGLFKWLNKTFSAIFDTWDNGTIIWEIDFRVVYWGFGIVCFVKRSMFTFQVTETLSWIWQKPERPLFLLFLWKSSSKKLAKKTFKFPKRNHCHRSFLNSANFFFFFFWKLIQYY